ncbi:hypothetical protein PPTG_23758 [Phytophthora nicotianae INRA-310]|uniref:Uncharacterized protein n=1 Tax=Phytophthora nicotianae (strain INRA-310) TaxID=761204 RepID=W2PU94_PHYN3|nr:hypothetical protein PPTG_23758 [Phytophthora nicotianae INRA-310]ETN03605.1 hypothetical protein PPTG_23758 [Phytophthora nicotianae INRA-310]
MAAFKSNHDIQILLGGKNVVNLIYYYCKYVTKTQHQVDSVAAVGLAAFQRREDKELVEQNEGVVKSDNLQVSKKRVAALAFNLTTRQEMAGPLVAW